MNSAGESASSESNASDSDGDEAIWGPEMPKAGEWIQVEPGGETTCIAQHALSILCPGRSNRPNCRLLQEAVRVGMSWTCSVAGAIF